MHKIKILDVNQERQIFEKDYKPRKKKKELIIKINDW
jgi:hypothetical protein